MIARARVRVDWPLEGEEVSPRGGTILLASDAACVELAVDGGEWRPARPEGAGLWRHEWSGAEPGRHQVLARARLCPRSDWTVATRRFRAAGR